MTANPLNDMCGIFGATNFNDFERLYAKNKIRGTFAHGFIYIKRNGATCVKRGPGARSLTGEYAWQHQLQYDMFAGHTQSPTSSVRDYDETTSHPFETDNFIVSHNGVLENHLDLAKQHEIPISDVNVDSKIIPMLLDNMYVGSDVLVIQEVCNMLKGIFSCWIYCKPTKLLYVVRNGSTLYTDANKSKFTSLKYGDADQEIEQGHILCFTSEGLTTVGEFTPSNPFFIF